MWWPSPSWIFRDINFAGKTSCSTQFSVSESNLVQMRSKMAELMPFNWFRNGGRRHLGFFTYVSSDSKPRCTIQFSAHVWNLVQIYAKMSYLWPKVWFSIWRPPPSWILRDTNLAFKISNGTPCSVPVSNLMWIRSKMAELWPYNCCQNSGRRHLGFLHYVNFDGKSGSRPHFQPIFQTWCKYIQKWPTYGWKCDFQYGRRRHLGFCEISILPVKPVTQPHFLALYVKFGANPFKNGGVMAI